jgi:hypothetical protein
MLNSCAHRSESHFKIYFWIKYSKNKKFWEELFVYFRWYDTDHIENDASNNSSIVACVFVTAPTFLLNRFLATIWEIFTKPLPSNDKGNCLPSRCVGTIGRGDTQTHTQTAKWSHKPILFFQNKKSRVKIISLSYYLYHPPKRIHVRIFKYIFKLSLPAFVACYKLC